MREEEKGPRWLWREKQMRATLRGLSDDYLALAVEVSCWDRDRSENLDRLALLEERLMRVRTSADLTLEHAGALLDHAARTDEPGAMPRNERMDLVTAKLLGEARRNADRR